MVTECFFLLSIQGCRNCCKNAIELEKMDVYGVSAFIYRCVDQLSHGSSLLPPVMANSLLVGLSLFVLPFLPTSQAYSWSFVHAPQQCANLSIVVNGTDGTPPYSVLIIPFGPTPLPNAIEARKIVNMPFPGTDNKVSFQLKYPADSQFVAVVCCFPPFSLIFNRIPPFRDNFTQR